MGLFKEIGKLNDLISDTLNESYNNMYLSIKNENPSFIETLPDIKKKINEMVEFFTNKDTKEGYEKCAVLKKLLKKG